MKHISLEDVPGDKPEREEKPPKKYFVEDECWWQPGLRMTSMEADKSTKLDGKVCNCGETLEFRLTHVFDRYRQDPMIGGPGFGSTPIHKRAENVVCPKCGTLHSMEVYEKWREEKYPRRPGCIDLEAVKKSFLRNRRPDPPRPEQRFHPGRRRGDDETRYRSRVI